MTVAGQGIGQVHSEGWIYNGISISKFIIVNYKQHR